jgi:hypothetical protein
LEKKKDIRRIKNRQIDLAVLARMKVMTEETEAMRS